jgi:hypothetical protein
MMSIRNTFATLVLAVATFGEPVRAQDNTNGGKQVSGEVFACEAIALTFPDQKALNRYIQKQVAAKSNELSGNELDAYKKHVTECASVQWVQRKPQSSRNRFKRLLDLRR